MQLFNVKKHLKRYLNNANRKKKMWSSKVNKFPETPLLNYSKLQIQRNKTNFPPEKRDTFVIPNYQRKFVAFRFRELAGKEQSRSFLFLFHFFQLDEKRVLIPNKPCAREENWTFLAEEFSQRKPFYIVERGMERLAVWKRYQTSRVSLRWISRWCKIRQVACGLDGIRKEKEACIFKWVLTCGSDLPPAGANSSLSDTACNAENTVKI